MRGVIIDFDEDVQWLVESVVDLANNLLHVIDNIEVMETYLDA